MLNQRCQHIINLKKFQNEASNDHFEWQVDGSNSKLILTYFKKTTEVNSLLCREALAQLLNARSTKRLASLTYKEFESFLRDENITPAFNPETNIIIENLFDKERTLLMMDIFLHFYQSEPHLSSTNFIGRIRQATLVLKLCEELFGAEYAMKCLHFEHEYLYYNGKNNNLSEESKLLMEKIFHFVFKQDIKLVAV